MNSIYRRKNYFVVLVFLAVLGLAGVADGRTITVDDDGPADFDNIQAAINDANDGDTVEVQAGTYTGTGNRDIDFLGKAITVRSTDPNDPNVVDTTVIDCQAGYYNRHRGFKFHSGEGPDSVLSGITITGGYGPQEEYIDLPFHLRAAAGGGIFCDGSSPTITRCKIINNVAKGITSGLPPSGGGGFGGGICCWNSSTTLDNCIVNNNSAVSVDTSVSVGGGVFYSFGGSGVITNCTISDNSVTGTWPTAGGIDANNCTIRNCLVNGNFSGKNGGGIVAINGTVTNCIIMDNEAASRGGGLYYCTAPITNCIIWKNIAAIGPQLYDSVNPTYSSIEDWTGGGVGNISLEPDLRTDGHLRADSPCINAGDPNYVPGPNETDIDGEERVHNGIIDIGIDEFIDTDGDGMPDWWEQKYFGSPISASPSDDADGDGLDNLKEYNIGFNPLVATTSYYVDPQDGDDSWDGLAPVWDGIHGPKATIQAAIDIAEDYEKVILSPGTYKGDGNRDLDFKGKAITVRSTDPNDANVVAVTVIDCNGTNSNRHRGFYFHSGEGLDSVVNGLTITNGYAPKEWVGDNWDYVGGAILCDNSSPTIKNCNITRNKSRDYGGGICCYNCSPAIINCSINNNTAWDGGGGMACRNGSPIITNCTITGNSVNYERGGGIYCWQSNPIISNCIISGNGAEGGGGIRCGESSPTIDNCIVTDNSGGGMSCWGGTAVISNCIISNNRLSEPGCHGGGGIFCSDVATIIDCTITGNTTIDEGGGIHGGWSSSLTITNCVISGNRARYGGGGLSKCYGPITNCIVSGNFASYGGGLYRCGGSITNCTIMDNMAKRGGGFGECPISITNCIIWGNSASDGPQLYNSAEPNYSCIQDWIGGGECNIDAEPQFALEGDYHLMPDSACIDAGSNAPASGLPATDKDGVHRPLDGNGDANAVADIGAYEYSPNSPAIAVSAKWFYFIQDWTRPEPQTLLIRNCGGQPLQWEIAEDCNWLEVAPANGVSTDKINEVAIMVDPNGLAPGIYNYAFEVQDANASNSPVSILVTMPVGEVLQVPSVFPTIQAAIDAAENFDVVVVTDGNYTGHGNRDIDFLGKVITVRSENGPNNCIIDCENSGNGFYFNNGETDKSLVDGLTITKGSYGIICAGDRYNPVSPTINNCIITGNSGRYEGGGIYCWYESSPKISNCIITDNTGGRDTAGGISYGYPSRSYNAVIASVTNCTVSNNKGGGISFGSKGALTITDCNISNNNGSGVSSGYESGLLRIENCNISNNSGGSGVICQEGGPLIITNCKITDNNGHSSPWGMGGGIWWIGGEENKAMITSCKIAGNQAYGAGGVFCVGGSIIENCIINNNLATHTNSYGGGVFCVGNTEIKNSTLCGNSSKKYGGSMMVEGSCSIANCILWGNTSEQGSQIFAGNPYSPQGTLTVAYSDVQGGQSDIYVVPGYSLDWGAGNIDSNPCFVDLGYWADVNDPNIIVEPNDPNAMWNEGDYHLLPTSPCIDVGDPNYVAGLDETDLDGNRRVVDGDNDGNSVVDMGAYEYRPPTPAELILELADDVMALNLHEGIENSLNAKLNAALGALEDENANNDIAAINTLGAFINAVEAHRGKKVPEAEADALIAAAQEIIELLSDS